MNHYPPNVTAGYANLEELKRVAQSRATLSGIPHYVLANGSDVWVAGKGARGALWPSVRVLFEAVV